MSAPRPEIAAIQLPAHGAAHPLDLCASGISVPVIDFSASLNPLGAPPGLSAALAAVDVAPYPDPWARPLRAALSSLLGVAEGHLLVGNGLSELIWLVALAYLRPGDHALLIGPTFGEYARACQVASAQASAFDSTEARQFRLDIDRLLVTVARAPYRLVVLCNPNNPTGLYLGRPVVQALAEASDALLVVDEAYLPFVEPADELIDLAVAGRLLLLRSLTKAYALAGLRLGYALGSAEAIGALRNVQPPWSVNSLAQAAGVLALGDLGHLARGRAVVAESRRYLRRALSELGFVVMPSAANFLLVHVGDGAAISRRLLAQGLAVRDCASFGLPAYIRIGIRTLPECHALVAALAALLLEPVSLKGQVYG